MRTIYRFFPALLVAVWLGPLVGCQLMSGDKQDCDTNQLGKASSRKQTPAAGSVVGNSTRLPLVSVDGQSGPDLSTMPELSSDVAQYPANESPLGVEESGAPFTAISFPPAPTVVEMTGPLLVPAMISADDALVETANLPLVQNPVDTETSAAANSADSVAR